MLIKSIELKNFRQFKGRQKINFSTEDDENITLIKGDNGAGKTTLLESFNWCLYENLDLPNKKSLLTKELANKLGPEDTEEVFVEIKLIHNNHDYIVRRTYNYMKLNSGDLDRISRIEKVQFKKSDGTLTDIDIDEVYNILPDDLSTYFFFDGERIENLSKADRSGKKDISNAVKNILGLDILLNAQKHLKKLMKEFEEEYNEDNSDDMSNLKDELNELRNKHEKYNQLIKTKKKDEKLIKDKIEDLNQKIKANSSAQNDQELREKFENQIEDAKEDIASYKNDIEQNNKNSFPEFLASKLISLCSDKINISNIKSKGILGIDGSAIDRIIEDGECICGQEIKKGGEHYKNLIEQKKYQPPASLGTIILQFNNQTEKVKNIGEDFFDYFEDKYKKIEKKQNNIEKLEKEINNISQRLKGSQDIKSLEKDREKKKEELEDIHDDIIEYSSELKNLKNSIESKEAKLDEKALKNKKNNKVAIRKKYASEIKKEINDYYNRKERKVRKDLNEEVEKIFDKLIETNHKIEINSDYSFKVVDIDGEEATSQGQDVITSFAFIGGLINLAKEKVDDIEVSEPYPLIMDAPFSKLSDSHRENVISIMPEIVEQFILFTVDSQFDDKLEESVKSQIGKKYNLKMYIDDEKYTEII